MIKRFLQSLDQLSAWVVDAAAFVVSLVVVGLMMTLVIGRYVFGWTYVGLLELIMLSGMWLYMLGILTASRRSQHLVVDYFEQKIKAPRAKALLKTAIGCVTLFSTLFFTFLAWKMLQWGFVRPQSMPGTGIPLWFPQSAILLAATGCTIYALRDIVIAATGIFSTSKD